ncbi:hypothetical protein FD755_025590, partial [Muntiacus reevesi]
MKTVKGFCMLFMLHLCLLDSGRTGKILVWPVDFSHWINLQVILEELHLRGHEITVLVPSQNLLIDHTKIPYHVEILQLSVTEETFTEELNTMLYEETFELPKLSWWERQIKLANLDRQFLLINKRVCDSAVNNKELLSRLQAAKFDVCIADPLSLCGELVAELLNIPFIYTFRFFSGNVIERQCAGLPMPSSYVPGVTSRLTDQMTFIQRLENWLLYTVSDMLYTYYVFPEWDEYYSKVLVSYLFTLLYCLWGSQGKNTEVIFHSLVQCTRFCCLWGKLGFVLMSKDKFNESLIQLSAYGQGWIPSLLFGKSGWVSHWTPKLPTYWGFSFTLEIGISFIFFSFSGIQHSVHGCTAASCNFGVHTGEDEHLNFILPSRLLTEFCHKKATVITNTFFSST